MPNRITTLDYRNLLVAILPKQITWRIVWHKACYPLLATQDCAYMFITGVHQSTPYVPIHVLRQLALRQDLFNFPTIFEDICKLEHQTSNHTWSILASLWDNSHTGVSEHPRLVSAKTQAMTPAYEQWLLHEPPIQPITPLASISSNKR